MKEDKHLRPDEDSSSAADSAQAPPASPGRRKLAKAGLSAPVLMTVASRSAWGNQCSISGIQSGNVSRAAVEAPCEGCSVSYWLSANTNSWPIQHNVRFVDVFNIGGYGPQISLRDVLRDFDDNLGAQAVAAYLNSLADINFGYTSSELVSLVFERWNDGSNLLGDLQLINGQNCPLP